ncbi:MAG: NUDIX domain-containing protein [Pseudomonadota bacterium]
MDDLPKGTLDGNRPGSAARPGPITIPAIRPDGTLYPIEKMEAHEKAAFHLAVSVFVFDGDAMLVQQRAAVKYHCGGQWANTCCTHPHWGEDLPSAAARRLHEELGFTLPLTKQRVVEYKADVGNGLTEHERVTMYRAEVDRTALTIVPNPDEVDDTSWMTAGELHAAIAAAPETFTPWFRIYVERYPNLDF